MGLHLKAKVNPKYWDSINKSGEDYRQFDEITFVNTETGREKTFPILAVSPMDYGEQEILKRLTPDISWDGDRVIYRIELGIRSRKPKKK